MSKAGLTHESMRPWPRYALTAILLFALVLRLQSIDFGLPALNDPDELMFEMGALRMLRGPTLNPGWFGHPATTTMYVLAVTDILVFVAAWLTGWASTVKDFANLIYADPSWAILPGRIMMTIFAIGTLALTCRLTTRLFGPGAGLVAAALLAVSPVHITWSQIIRSDMMACFFMLLCLLSALNIMERNRPRDYIVASFWLAVAIATKWPFALSALSVGGAVLLLRIEKRIETRSALARLLLVTTAAPLFLFILSPYVLLDYPTVLRNLGGESQVHHLGSTGGTWWQNAGWYVTGPLYSGLGLAGFLLIVPGCLLIWSNSKARLLLLPLATGFWIVLCTQTLVWERWALPLLPLFAIAIGAAVIQLARSLPGRWSVGIGAMLLLALFVPPIQQSRAEARARLNDTRQISAQWARSHIPAGSTVMIEHFAFDLVNQPWHFLFPLGDMGCVDAIAYLHGKVGYGTIDQARGLRTNVDYGTMAAARRASCRADFAILTQYDRYLAERSAFPVQYAAYRDLVSKGRVMARFVPRPGVSGGPVVTIVRFTRHPAPSLERAGR